MLSTRTRNVEKLGPKQTTTFPVDVRSSDYVKLMKAAKKLAYEKLSRHSLHIEDDEITEYAEDLIRYQSDKIKIVYAELKPFSPEETVILSKKRDYLTKIKRGLTNALSTVLGVGLLSSSKNHVFFTILETVRENGEDVSLLIFNLFETDYSMEDENENKDDKKIIASVEEKRLSSILKNLKVPEAIALDFEDICNKGIDFSTLFSLATNLWTRYAATQEADNVSAFTADF